MISLTRKTFLRVITVLMLTLLFVTASAYASESLVVYSPLHEEELLGFSTSFLKKLELKQSSSA